MLNIKRARNMRTVPVPKGIPVRAGCCTKPFMHYDIANLFTHHGNMDGDDGLLCHIAERVISVLEEKGYSIECTSSIHNSHYVDMIKWSDGEWKNTLSGASFSRSAEYAKLWQLLPDAIRAILFKLSLKGITLLDQQH